MTTLVPQEVWFTADWHLGHQRILNLGAGRPFTTIEAHDEHLIRVHNSRVRPDDIVWVLGDVAMGHIAESLANCRRMNGRKFLVCGNHDRPTQWQHRPDKCADWTRRYLLDGGFTAVVLDDPPGSVTVQLPQGHTATLSHYPYAGESGPNRPDRYSDRRPQDLGRWLLHGHVHDAWDTRGRQINVGVDRWGYGPVNADDIADIITAAIA
jgi:calcineurin-like phosphoesterase family protein